MRRLTTTIILLMLCVATVFSQKAPEFYAVFDGKNTVTAYYDGNMPDNAYHFNTDALFPLYNIKKVVFDQSVRNYAPTSCESWFSYCENLSEIEGLENLNTKNVTSMSGMFYRCISLKKIDLSHLNTENVTDMSEMFAHCWELEKIDLSHLDTKNVTDMTEMFSNCYKLETIDVSRFNTSKVTKMEGMFMECNGLKGIDLSSFDTRNVSSMSEMFSGCYSIDKIDLSGFRTENLTNTSYMFSGCRELKTIDISGFRTYDVTDMGNMFSSCIMLRTIVVGDGWNTAAVTSTEPMFSFCRTICGGTGTRYDKSKIDKEMAKVQGGYLTIKGQKPYLPKAYAVVRDSVLTLYYGDKKPADTRIYFIGNYEDETKNIKEVIFDYSFRGYRPDNCIAWFQGLTNLQKITGMREYLVTDYVTDMSNMFKYCGIKSLDLSAFNTSKVTDMSEMFAGCNNLEVIFVGYTWKTDAVKKSDQMFYGCRRLYGAKGTPYSMKHTDVKYAHIDDGEKNPGYFTQKWQKQFVPEEKIADKDEPYVLINNEVATFYYGKKRFGNHYYTITNYPRQFIKKAVFDETFRFYTPKTCNRWFNDCANLTEIVGMDKYLDTEQVTDMTLMFGNCAKLEKIDLSGFKTANVTKMDRMFSGCRSLKSIDLSKLDTKKVVSIDKMFAGCNSLKTIDLSHFDTQNITNMRGLFSDCISLEKLDLTGFNTANVTNMYGMFRSCYNLETLDLSSFNTARVSNMGDMFCYCSGLKTIYVSKDWTTRAIPNKEIVEKLSEIGGNGTTHIFTGCTSLCGEKGTLYCYAFNGKDYAKIDAGKNSPGYLTTKGSPQWNKTAYAILKNGTLTFYYRASVPNGAYVIHGGKSTQPWSHAATSIKKVVFDVSFRSFRPNTCYEWFSQCGSLTSIEGMKENLNTENVVNMAAMFYGCCSLKDVDLSGLKTQNVTTMHSMFSGCVAMENLDLSSFDTRNVNNMALMFDGCKGLMNINLDGFDTHNVKNMSRMFFGCKNLQTIDVSGFNTSNCENMSFMFAESGISQVDLSSFTTEGITHLTGYYGFEMLTGMFEGCENLKSLDISSFVGAKYSPGMFFGCTNLRKIKLFPPKNSEFGNYTDTGNDLSGLFAGCSNLRELDLTSFKKPDAPRSMKYMFANCSQLRTIYATEDWEFQYVFTLDSDSSIEDKTVEYQHNFTGLFLNCINLRGGKGTKWEAENQSNEMYLTIDGGADAPGYFTKK
ncbi:MAG: BspA family leucine-rich repeat surface protein [Bacteroidales bacterium]|nr:BspA family leucine-rich repeat surface protein [Bacteroidales bacterium]